ncbi:MAG: methyltransferase domain-containing protein [Anaerolineaceae bacterium]
MDVLRPTETEALAEWARRVRANRDQAERVREAPERPDFYAPVAASFKADPRRTNEEALNFLLSLVQSDDRWLDIGAGGGRYALPLALASREVVALDPSEGMLRVLREGMAEHDIRNVRIVQSRWPASEEIRVDACLISHIGYDIEEIGPFLNAMEEAAGRLCVAILLGRSPAFVAEPFWPLVHGEERASLPALREFLALQLARGRICEVRLSRREAGWYRDDEAALGFLRQQLFVEPGGAGDAKLRAAVAALPHDGEGRVPSSTEPVPLGIVSWRPR